MHPLTLAVDGHLGPSPSLSPGAHGLSATGFDTGAGSNATVFLSDSIPEGTTIPAGTKTLRFWVYTDVTTGDIEWEADILVAGATEDHNAEKTTLGSATVTQSASTAGKLQRVSITFTNALTAGKLVLVELRYMTTSTLPVDNRVDVVNPIITVAA